MKVALVLVSLGIVTSLLFALSGNRQPSETRNEPVFSEEEADAHIVISKFHQTSSKDGLVEWSLDADTAMMNQESKKAAFKNLSMTFYLEAEKKVYLTADAGSLELESKNMDISGNVVITNDDYVLKTEKMQYRHAQRLFSSTAPISIRGGASELMADALTYDLKTNRATFDGRVRGDFGDAVTL